MSGTRLGDCYQAAGSLVCFGRYYSHGRARELPAGAVLVHGRPTLQRAPYVRFGHAWVEYVAASGDTAVVEVANGRWEVYPAGAYYRAGRIDAAECYRYTRDEARAMAAEREHWGPWEGVEGL